MTQIKILFTEKKGIKNTMYPFTVLTLHDHQSKSFIKHIFSNINTKRTVTIFSNLYIIERFIDLPSKKFEKKV